MPFMMVNAKVAALAAAAIALGAAAGAVAAPTPHLAFARPPARPFHAESFHHRQAFRDTRNRFGGALPFYGGYSGFYGSDPAEEAAYAPPPPPYGPPPAVYAAPADSGTVCPAVWTWSERRHEATRRNYCD